MAKASKPKPADDELSFDEALKRLEELAGRLEQGDIPLEDALQVYEEAVGLFSVCRGRLDSMEQRIEKLSEDLEGNLTSAEIEAPEGEGRGWLK